MLFVLWDASIDRPTKDLDLAGFWTNDAGSLLTVIQEILAIPCPEDGVTFMSDSVTAEPIRHKPEYHGFRLHVIGEFAAARISLQIDVGFGDAIEPPAVFETYPVVLDAPAPRIRAYPREAAIAEKLHAMVSLGLENSRLKDFYDGSLARRPSRSSLYRSYASIIRERDRTRRSRYAAWCARRSSHCRGCCHRCSRCCRRRRWR